MTRNLEKNDYRESSINTSDKFRYAITFNINSATSYKSLITNKIHLINYVDIGVDKNYFLLCCMQVVFVYEDGNGNGIHCKACMKTPKCS